MAGKQQAPGAQESPAEANGKPRPRRVRRRPKIGQSVPYDVSHVASVEPIRNHDWRSGGDDADVMPGSFAARVERRRIDLVARVREGVPPREYHAHSEGMLVRGKRHLIAAPKKSGKSIACLAHWVRLALAGERAAILDRENGADVYAERLELIMDAWQLTPEQRTALDQDLLYFEYPRLRRHDGEDLARYFADELAVRLVCFDSQRMFLTDYGLKEKDSDDYSDFMGYAVDPLHLAGLTTVILDNTGHENTTRSRGTVTKGDLNEVLMHLETVRPFNRLTTGAVRLVLDDSRFGDHGHWTMQIGGGVFGEWESSVTRIAAVEDAKPDFKDAAMAVLKDAARPKGVHKLFSAVRERDVQIKDKNARELLRKWAADPDEPIRWVPKRGYEYVAVQPVAQARPHPEKATTGP
jgi:hypothetical protein